MSNKKRKKQFFREVLTDVEDIYPEDKMNDEDIARVLELEFNKILFKNDYKIVQRHPLILLKNNKCIRFDRIDMYMLLEKLSEYTGLNRRIKYYEDIKGRVYKNFLIYVYFVSELKY